MAIHRDSQDMFMMGYYSGYERACNDWKEKIYSIKSEIENYEDFDSMDRQVVKVVFSIMDKYMEDSNNE